MTTEVAKVFIRVVCLSCGAEDVEVIEVGTKLPGTALFNCVCGRDQDFEVTRLSTK